MGLHGRQCLFQVPDHLMGCIFLNLQCSAEIKWKKKGFKGLSLINGWLEGYELSICLCLAGSTRKLSLFWAAIQSSRWLCWGGTATRKVWTRLATLNSLCKYLCVLALKVYTQITGILLLQYRSHIYLLNTPTIQVLPSALMMSFGAAA